MQTDVEIPTTFNEDEWDPELYLRQYFVPDVASDPTIKFIVEEARRPSGGAVAIDVGCGPTVCYWAALAPYVSGVYLADYLEINLETLRRWVETKPGMYDWSTYTRLSLEYEGQTGIGPEEIAQRDAVARAKVRGYLYCDVTLPDPLGPAQRGQYDCVTCFYCIDGLTGSKSEWRTYLQHVFSLLKPGGFFIGASLRNCAAYQFGGKLYASPNVNETDFAELLQDSGFDLGSIRVEVGVEGFPSDPERRQQLVDLYKYDQVVLASGFMKAW